MHEGHTKVFPDPIVLGLSGHQLNGALTCKLKIGSTVDINHGVQRLQLIILREQSTNLQFTALV